MSTCSALNGIKWTQKTFSSGNKGLISGSDCSHHALRWVIHALAILWIDSAVMSEGITHQQLCRALWIGTSSTVQTKSTRAKEENRFQLEKLHTPCLNRNTYPRRLSPKVADGKRWKTQTFRMVEGEMFVSFFKTRAEAAARVCVCVRPSTWCSAADDGGGQEVKGRTQGWRWLAMFQPQQMLSSPRCQRCRVTRGDQMEDYVVCLLSDVYLDWF